MESYLINSLSQYNNDISIDLSYENEKSIKNNSKIEEPKIFFLQNESYDDIFKNYSEINPFSFDPLDFNRNILINSNLQNNLDIEESERNVIRPISIDDNNKLRKKKFLVQKLYQINSTNETLSKTYQDLFNESFENFETIGKTNFLKKKRTRRTKEEILKSKNNIISNEVFQHNLGNNKRKIGRKLKGEKRDSSKKCHDDKTPDNIAKKLINISLKSNIDWLNSSFVDSNDKSKFIKIVNGNQKFGKIDPKIIEKNLKKELMMDLFDTKLEKIFYNNLNSKYNKINNNKILIEKLKNDDQPFVKYILNLTFEEAFNIFCNKKEIKIDNKEFKEKFKTLDFYIKEIVEKKRKNNINEEEIKDYIKRLIALSLYFKQWYENKHSRNKNKS